MKLPWQKSSEDTSTASVAGSAADNADAAASSTDAKQPLPKGYTPPKGRPTPSRREVEIERGVIRDPSMTNSSAQASARRKELKKSMPKDEWKAYKANEKEVRRKQQRETQAAMDRGDERYLMARDQGPERAFVRDWIDSHRYINTWVMPVALALLVILFIGTWLPTFANIMSTFAMMLMVVFFIEGIWLARRTNKAVRAKFPGTTAAGIALGFYSYSRATQPRKWRSPKPRVKVGDQI